MAITTDVVAFSDDSDVLDQTGLEPVKRLSRDIVKASGVASVDEARYLVDTYYQLQDYRKASNNQARSLIGEGEPHEVITWAAEQMDVLENQIKRALAAWADSQPVAVWAQTIVGIGPVISAGLSAHIDISRAPTAGHIWRFAGLDPTSKWLPKTKRPWNAALKVLCWKIGESFVKVSGNPNDIYGKVYAERKALEISRNDNGDFAEQAAAILASKNIGKDTDAYKAYVTGKLPPAHIHARAKRYAVKLFLSHYHHVAYKIANGEPPPFPYVLTLRMCVNGHVAQAQPEGICPTCGSRDTRRQHSDFIGPPNWSATDKAAIIGK